MTTAHHAISDEELHPFVDGELDSKRAAQIEALLADETVAAEAVQGIRAQKARLHLAFDGVLDERSVMDSDQNGVVVRHSIDHRPARERCLDCIDALGHLGAGRAHAEPDLRARHVIARAR